LNPASNYGTLFFKSIEKIFISLNVANLGI
jgi:hypothetical protein